MKKKVFLLTLSLGLASLMTVTSLASCGPSKEPSGDTPSNSTTEEKPFTPVDPIGIDSGTYEVEGVEGGASGAYSYVGKPYEERTQILGKLESYAYQNHLTGLPLFENGGYVMYHPRIEKGTDKYIPGYGYGILGEGNLTKPMTAEEEPDAKYRNYLHQWNSSDPRDINGLGANGSQVSDLHANISSGLWGTKMNQSKDGYEWYGVLSKDNRPIAVNPDPETHLASKWKMHVRTGEEAQYRTASKLRSKYDKRNIELEDYETVFKFLLTKKNGLFRGGELAGKTGNSGIKGAAQYYEQSADGFNEEAWKDVGVKTGTDEKGAYLEIELMAPTTQFYAMYNLASNLYNPIPAEFIKEVGVENFGRFSSNKSTAPLDNILCVGPYYLESWEEGKLITFHQNEDWWEVKEGRYKIEGIHQQILSGYDSDITLPFKEFIAGHLDSASIPGKEEYLNEYKDDPRTTTVPGDSVFKLNVNSCTPETWEAMFGENGSIAQTKKSEYWNVKPWMSNPDFLDGLMFSIDRETFAKKNGSIASSDYFSGNYMADPEKGISYNDTKEHKDALIKAGFETEESLKPGAKRLYGFRKQIAVNKFSKAVTDLMAAGKVKKNQQLTIDIWWMYQNNIKQFGDDIAKFLQDAFNAAPAAKSNGVTLKVNNEAVQKWDDVYYKHLMVGQFDLGFGSISGNALDPLNFMEVLKSDNSSGFTLNWGVDTSKPDKTLEYDNVKWSFDTLWKAADQGVIMEKGVELDPVIVTFGKDWCTMHEDGTITFKVDYSVATKKFELPGCKVEDLVFSLFDGTVQLPLSEEACKDPEIAELVSSCKVTETSVEFTMTKAATEYFFNASSGAVAVVAEYKLVINGALSEGYTMGQIVSVLYPAPAAE